MRPPRPPQQPIPVPTWEVYQSVLRDNALVLNCGVPIQIKMEIDWSQFRGIEAVIE